MKDLFGQEIKEKKIEPEEEKFKRINKYRKSDLCYKKCERCYFVPACEIGKKNPDKYVCNKFKSIWR